MKNLIYLLFILMLPILSQAQEYDSYWDNGIKFETYKNGPIEILGYVKAAKTPIGKQYIFHLDIYNHSDNRLLFDATKVQVLGFRDTPIEDNIPVLLKTLTADSFERKVKSKSFAEAVFGFAATVALTAAAVSTDNENVSDLATIGAVTTAAATTADVDDKLYSRHAIYYDYLKKTTIEECRSAHGILLSEYQRKFKALVLRITFGDHVTHKVVFNPDPKKRVIRYDMENM